MKLSVLINHSFICIWRLDNSLTECKLHWKLDFFIYIMGFMPLSSLDFPWKSTSIHEWRWIYLCTHCLPTTHLPTSLGKPTHIWIDYFVRVTEIPASWVCFNTNNEWTKHKLPSYPIRMCCSSSCSPCSYIVITMGTHCIVKIYSDIYMALFLLVLQLRNWERWSASSPGSLIHMTLL